MVEEVRIPVEHPRVDDVGGSLRSPAEGVRERGSAVLLAHGAGAPPESDFMLAMADGLAARGFRVLTFRYPYMEQRARDGRQRGPDPAPVLEACHESARAFLAERAGGRRLVLAGKSMGGRISTHLAARGADCAGLAMFGYPLHPPGRPERQRSEHFPAIVQPTLFLQGTRDRLCDLDLLRKALERFGGSARLEVIEGADHGFAVPKRSGRSRDEVREDLLERFSAWERDAFGE